MIHDFINPNDPAKRSYKEVNLEKKHKISVGSLIELETGVRLFVVGHNRDCDGTPLYSLCADKDDVIVQQEGFGNNKWHLGYGEEDLKEISK